MEFTQIGLAKKIVILQGAGVSTASGISDYRGSKGWFSRYPIEAFGIAHFRRNPEVQYAIKRHFWSRNYYPNQGHLLAKALDQRLLRVITQNIDGLQYEVLKDTPEKLIEYHGNLRSAECAVCYKTYPIELLKIAVDAGTVWRCKDCNGPIKPKVIFYGETPSFDNIHQAAEDVHHADLVIVMGTSLKVYPFASLVYGIDAPIIMINEEIPPDYPEDLRQKTHFFIGDIETICSNLNKYLSK